MHKAKKRKREKMSGREKSKKRREIALPNAPSSDDKVAEYATPPVAHASEYAQPPALGAQQPPLPGDPFPEKPPEPFVRSVAVVPGRNTTRTLKIGESHKDSASDADEIVVEASAKDLEFVEIVDMNEDHMVVDVQNRSKPQVDTYAAIDAALGVSFMGNSQNISDSNVYSDSNVCDPHVSVRSGAIPREIRVEHGRRGTNRIHNTITVRPPARNTSASPRRLSPPRLVVDEALMGNPSAFDYLQDPATFVNDKRAMFISGLERLWRNTHSPNFQYLRVQHLNVQVDNANNYWNGFLREHCETFAHTATPQERSAVNKLHSRMENLYEQLVSTLTMRIDEINEQSR